MQRIISEVGGLCKFGFTGAQKKQKSSKTGLRSINNTVNRLIKAEALKLWLWLKGKLDNNGLENLKLNIQSDNYKQNDSSANETV